MHYLCSIKGRQSDHTSHMLNVLTGSPANCTTITQPLTKVSGSGLCFLQARVLHAYSARGGTKNCLPV